MKRNAAFMLKRGLVGMAGLGLLVPGLALAADLAIKPYVTGDEKRVDNPVDAWMIAYSGPAGKPVTGPADKPYAGFDDGWGYAGRYDIMDAVDRKQGNFSILFTVRSPTQAQDAAFGFFPGPYIHHWELDEGFTLHFWAKSDAAPTQEGWAVALYDTAGKRMQTVLGKNAINGKWEGFSLPLKKFRGDAGFAFGAIRAVQIEAELPQGARLWIDDLHFVKDGKAGEILGVSDKTITQYMAEAHATRPARVGEGFAKSPYRLYWQGKKDEANKATLDMIDAWINPKSPRFHKSMYNVYNPLEMRELELLYLAFSVKGRLKPGLMSPEVEKAVLDAIWLNTEFSNDISHARRSPWHITGSENHDHGVRLNGLFSSQIFKDEAAYKDRVYPNLGGSLFARRRKAAALAAGGVKDYRYNPEDVFTPIAWHDRIKHEGEKLHPADHYQAWVKSWKDFFAERARYGFGNEHNANGYASANIPPSLTVYTWAGDEELRRQARMFHDLIWAQWLQDNLLMFQGGAATRGGPGVGVTARIVEFLLGGPAMGGQTQSWRWAWGDYEWPRILWEMALADRTVKGEYAFVSRKPNEDEPVAARPEGTEDAMLLRRDSRIVRYSWVTPDYVFGVRMDHPRALYSHINGSGQGIVFPTTPESLIDIHPGNAYIAAQDRGVALLQAKLTSDTQTMPMYTFGPPGGPCGPAKVFIGRDVDRVEEKDGWIFAQEGDAYAAFRFMSAASGESKVCDKDGLWLLAAATNNYIWQTNATSFFRTGRQGRAAVATSSYTPLIVECSRKMHHATLEAFEADVLDNPLALKNVHGGATFLLTYRGCGKEARELSMNCIGQVAPKIGDAYVDYNGPAFDSPYLQGKSGDGVITLIGPISGKKLVFDFNKVERIEE